MRCTWATVSSRPVDTQIRGEVKIVTVPLEIIVGEQLNSVEFVQGYVQIRFDGPTLTLLVWPSLHYPNRMVAFGESGYRNELSARITHIVRKATLRDDEDLVIGFDDGVEIFVSLKPEARTGPEAGHFSVNSGDALHDF
jgi:hypothetical protein